MINIDILLSKIEKPNNQDVIAYDPNYLIDLLNINVQKKYPDLLKKYKQEFKSYQLEEQKMQDYDKKLNEFYLFNTSWTEYDYLTKINESKKTYAILYSNINANEKKIKALKSRLEILKQSLEDQKAIQQLNFNKQIENNKRQIPKLQNKLFKLERKMNKYNLDIEYYNNSISLLENTGNFIEELQSKINEHPELKKVKSINTLITNQISKFQNEINDFKGKIRDTKDDILIIEDDYNESKEELENLLTFNEQEKIPYHKKSIEILRIEGEINSTKNQIANIQQEIENDSKYNSKEFNALKDKINKYELSLKNLTTIKEYEKENKGKIIELKEKQDELKKQYSILSKMTKFLIIYYKICEEKINSVFEDITFKLYKILSDIEVIEDLKITVNSIEYANLDANTKNKVDRELASVFYKDI